MSQRLEEVPPGISAGRAALAAVAAGFGVLVVYQAFTLPEMVPAHVGPDGEVTRWGTRAGHVVTAALVGLGTFLTMWLLPKLVEAVPASLINLPHKEYWLKQENFPRAQRQLAEDIAWIGAATMALVGYGMWEVGYIAQGGTPPTMAWAVVIGLYLAVVLGWVSWMLVGPRWKPGAGTSPQG